MLLETRVMVGVGQRKDVLTMQQASPLSVGYYVRKMTGPPHSLGSWSSRSVHQRPPRAPKYHRAFVLHNLHAGIMTVQNLLCD